MTLISSASCRWSASKQLGTYRGYTCKLLKVKRPWFTCVGMGQFLRVYYRGSCSMATPHRAIKGMNYVACTEWLTMDVTWRERWRSHSSLSKWAGKSLMLNILLQGIQFSKEHLSWGIYTVHAVHHTCLPLCLGSWGAEAGTLRCGGGSF